MLFFSCKNSSTTLRGKLQGQMMAIGGETTGKILILENGERVEIEFEGNVESGQTVEVKGEFYQKQGPERGTRKILKVKELKEISF